MKRRRKKFNIDILIFSLVAIIIIGMGFGYAQIEELLSFQTVTSFKEPGILELVRLDVIESSNVLENSSPVFTTEGISFDLHFFGSEEKFEIIYEFEVVNNSPYNYEFYAGSFNPTINSTSGTATVNYELIDIEDGYNISPNEIKIFRIKISLEPTDPNASYDVSGDMETQYEASKTGSILATLTDNNLTGNLKTSQRVPFHMSLISTYEQDKNFNITLNGNTNFKIVDENGNALGSQTIHAGETEDYTFYIALGNNPVLPNNTETVGVYALISDQTLLYTDSVTLTVTPNSTPDTNPPQVGAITVTKNATPYSATLTWSGTDETTISNYTILVYTVSGGTETLSQKITTKNNNTSYTFSHLDEGDYVFKVYGKDSSGNTATDAQIASATTSTNVCRKSASTTLQWYYPVTVTITNGSNNASSTAQYAQNLTFRITANNNYNLPTSITVNMNGTSLTTRNTNASYYTFSNGNVTIYNVTGPITVTGTCNRQTCLVEGTKISLASGNYKNIEEITYHDLLKVWNYETGSITYEYPIWIEQTKKTNNYLQITFSDNSELKTVNDHGIFNLDANQFISVRDAKTGDHIAKISNDKIEEVYITNIEEKNEEVNYYHVVSTRYYNIIANNILTTDGTVILSNLYGFKDNITFNEKITTELYSKEELELPEYLYNGLRAGEGKYLNNYGLDLNTFKNYLKGNQLNKNMILSPIKDRNGNNLWKVSLSTGEEKIIKEGTYYKLPNNGLWLSTMDNKTYPGGSFVKIITGNHFTKLK